VLVHLVGGDLQARNLRDDQPFVRPGVIVGPDPLADDLFQLVEEVERLVFDVSAAAVDVRAL
jgi:hypothetical protein